MLTKTCKEKFLQWWNCRDCKATYVKKSERGKLWKKGKKMKSKKLNYYKLKKDDQTTVRMPKEVKEFMRKKGAKFQKIWDEACEKFIDDFFEKRGK